MSFVRNFPLGPVPLLLIFLCAASGAALLTIARPSPRADLDMWVFASTHEAEYRSRLAGWTAPGEKAEVNNLGTALRERLALALLTRQAMPDLFELEWQEVSMFL